MRQKCYLDIKTKENLNNDIAKLSSYFAVLATCLLFFSRFSSFFPTKIILIVETMNSLLSVIEYIYHRINNNLQTEAIFVVNKQLSTVLHV